MQTVITVESKHLRRFYSTKTEFHIEFTPKKCPRQRPDSIEKLQANRNYLDCFIMYQNMSLSCILPYYFRIERDLKHFGYKLCDNEMLNFHHAQNPNIIWDIKLIKQRCHDAYQDNCEDLSINSHQFSSGYTADNTTIVNIMPKYTINLNYQEQLKMDFNDLFYNVGGIIGMWIGWSVISIGSLFNLFFKAICKLYSIIKLASL